MSVGTAGTAFAQSAGSAPGAGAARLVAEAGESIVFRGPGAVITLSHDGSIMPSGTTVIWRHVGGPIIDAAAPLCTDLAQCVVQVDLQGVYVFELELRYHGQTSTDRVSVAVAEAPQWVMASCVNNDSFGKRECQVDTLTHRTVKLHGSVIDAIDGDAEVRWSIDKWSPGVSLLNADSAEATFSSQRPGTWKVTVEYRVKRVVDGDVFWDHGTSSMKIKVRGPSATFFMMAPLHFPHGDNSPPPYIMPTIGYHALFGPESRVGMRLSLAMGSASFGLDDAIDPDLLGSWTIAYSLVDQPAVRLSFYVGWWLAYRDKSRVEHGPDAGLQNLILQYKKWVVVTDMGYRYGGRSNDHWGRIRFGVGLGRTFL
jgi:hypothetical protein